MAPDPRQRRLAPTGDRGRSGPPAAAAHRASSREPTGSEPRGTFRPGHLFALLALMASAAVAFRVGGTRPENVVFLSLAVGATGLVAWAVYRTLWPLVASGEIQAPEWLGGRTRASLEREKVLTLRAIKDLEFDRAMKKVSEADWAEMTSQLRARAIRIMHQLDQGRAAYRAVVERELNARREAAGLASGPLDAPAAGPAKPSGPTCMVCQTANDTDARFCKACGARVGDAT